MMYLIACCRNLNSIYISKETRRIQNEHNENAHHFAVALLVHGI